MFSVHQGNLDDLTPRELQLLALMASGRSNRAIGQLLFLSDRTVEAHVRAIYRKLVGDEYESTHRRVAVVLHYLAHTADAEPPAQEPWAVASYSPRAA